MRYDSSDGSGCFELRCQRPLTMLKASFIQWLAAALRRAGLAMVFLPGVASAIEHKDTSPIDRVVEIRNRLLAADDASSSGSCEEAPKLFAWGNWPNWNDWSDWSNWPNWNDWPNWPNWGNY